MYTISDELIWYLYYFMLWILFCSQIYYEKSTLKQKRKYKRNCGNKLIRKCKYFYTRTSLIVRKELKVVYWYNISITCNTIAYRLYRCNFFLYAKCNWSCSEIIRIIDLKTSFLKNIKYVFSYCRNISFVKKKS